MEARLHVGFFSFIDNDWFWPLAVDRITEILAKSIAALSREAELHNERSHMAETGHKLTFGYTDSNELL